MEAVMLRLFLSFLIVLSLTVSVGQDGTLVARPAYCNEALQKCYDACDDLFSSDFYRTFCYAGCLIVYLDCGS